ncbi:MAG: TetR/AcrR family transcriptional regulator C-terminal domain-containing protein, partial [Candidatus Omnitrophota bacterium]
VLAAYLKKIQDLLESGKKEKIFRMDFDVRLASLAFFGLVQSTVTFWALSEYGFSIKKQKIESLFDIFIKGIVC